MLPGRRAARGAQIGGGDNHRLSAMKDESTVRGVPMERYLVFQSQHISALQRQRDLVGGNGPFAENHPRVASAGEIDDGGRHRAGGRPAIDDQRNLVAELLAHAVGVGTFGKPWRLAEVAVIGRPSAVTTAREIAASGTRSATLPVLAVTRSGSFEPALTMIVSGPGQNFSASRSNAESSWRAIS